MDDNLKELQAVRKSLSKELKDLRTQAEKGFERINKRLDETEERLAKLGELYEDQGSDSIMALLRKIEKNTTKRIH